jgi:hypothetical protein
MGLVRFFQRFNISDPRFVLPGRFNLFITGIAANFLRKSKKDYSLFTQS